MNNKYSVFVQNTAKNVEQTLFFENSVLKEICDIRMTSPNEQKEGEGTSKYIKNHPISIIDITIKS